MIPQVPTIQKIHHEVQILSVLKGVVHVYDKGVLQSAQKQSLVHNAADRLLANNLGLHHLLHRIYFLIFLKLYAPHLAETTLSNHIMVVETVLANPVICGSIVTIYQTAHVNTEGIFQLFCVLLQLRI